MSRTVDVREWLRSFAAPPAELRDRVGERWAVVLLVAATAAQAFATWRIVRRLDPGTRPGLRDSIIFEYIGWRLARGARLYVDLWEVKPPLAYELPAILALLVDDPFTYHWLAVLVTNAAAVATVLVVGALVREITGDGFAAVAGGLATFVHPVFGWRAPIGFKAKYFVVALGLLAVYLALRDRPLAAGIAGGASVGFWQFGIVFPALAFGLGRGRAGRSGARRFLAGAAAVWAVVLLPVWHWDALGAMVVETVLTPLLVRPQRAMAERIWYALRLIDIAAPVVLVGIYGAAVALRRDRRSDGWWVPAGALWFALVIVLADFDGPGDLIPLLSVLAVGVGLVVGVRREPAVVWAVAATAALSVATVGAFGVFGHLGVPAVHDVPKEMAVSPPYTGAERRFLFWRGRPSATCRPFFGLTQFRLVHAIDGSLDQATCGRWAPVREALLAKYG